MYKINNKNKFLREKGELIMEKKMTKKECLEAIVEMLTETELTEKTAQIVDFANKEIEQLSKRAETARAKAAEKRAAEDPITPIILSVLKADEFLGLTDVTNAVSAALGEEITAQKITPRLSTLVNSNQVIKDPKAIGEEGKKKTGYKLA